MEYYIYPRQFAEIVRRLREQGVRDDDRQLFEKFYNAFQSVLGGAFVPRASQINIDLPNLEDSVQPDIVRDNVTALSAVYFAAQLEELKFFAVADKVAEQFMTGVIPTSRGEGGNAIYMYLKDPTRRFTESERRSMYARAFGFAQGSVDEPMPNREFADLWIRFLSAVSLRGREIRATTPLRVSEEQIFKSARDLAVNISLHGYGIAHFAAVEFQEHIKAIIKMLSYPDVLQAYGVNDTWQLVERVSGLYLGGAVNSVRQRTLAQSGSRIIQWLAYQQPVLSSPYAGHLDFRRTPPPASITIQDEAERWLAVTGTDDASVERFSEPVSMASQPTIPSLSLQAMPESLQNLMQGAGGLQGAMQNLATLTPAGTS